MAEIQSRHERATHAHSIRSTDVERKRGQLYCVFDSHRMTVSGYSSLPSYGVSPTCAMANVNYFAAWIGVVRSSSRAIVTSVRGRGRAYSCTSAMW